MNRIVVLMALAIVVSMAGCGKLADSGPQPQPTVCKPDECFCSSSHWWWSEETGRMHDGSGKPMMCMEGAYEPMHFHGAKIIIWGATYCHNCGPTKEWFTKHGVTPNYYLTDKEDAPPPPTGHDRLPICALEQNGRFVADADGFLGCIELYEQMR